MNARRTIFMLVALTVVLLTLNSMTLYRLLCARGELREIRTRALAEKNSVAAHKLKPDRAVVPEAPLSATQSVSIILGEVNQENGLRQVYDMKDGITAPATIDGATCRRLTRPGELMKIHFTVDPSFKKGVMRVWAEVEYFDAAPDSVLSIEYDGPKAYTPSERRVRLKNASQWKTATFEFTDAEFKGRENGGADFRIIASKPKVFVRRVTLKSE